MIPPFNKRGVLPPGKPYRASWKEVIGRFGTNDHRLTLLTGLKAALANLKGAGCTKFYLDGSFITAKQEPVDWDGCWELEGVDLGAVDPVIINADFFPDRMKEKYSGDLFLQAARLPGGNFLARFQRDRDGLKKGIVVIDLETLP